MHKPIILVFVGAYLPGYKAGGPIRSIVNLVEVLGDEFEFRILCPDYDHGESEPYQGIVPDTWTQVGKAQVMYLSRKGRSTYGLLRLMRDTPFDVLYLNSFFSRRFSMLPFAFWRLRLIRQVPVVLAPRGEFSRGALGLKSALKRTYIGATRLLRWYAGYTVLWQASSQFELNDIVLVQSQSGSITVAGPLPGSRGTPLRLHRTPDAMVASDLPSPGTAIRYGRPKPDGAISIAFVGRVNRMKNLDFALQVIGQVSGAVKFDIYGPQEDSVYWGECAAIINSLDPSKIEVRYVGQVPHAEISDVMAKHDILLFPTLGENYGHVICEALSAGCPVIISDQTPWRGLQDLGVGWDLPLDDVEAFRSALQTCIDMGPDEFAALSQRAAAYGAERSTDQEAVEQNRRLFQRALELADPAKRARRHVRDSQTL